MAVVPTASMKAAPMIPLTSFLNMINVSYVARDTMSRLLLTTSPAVAVRGAASTARARTRAGEGRGRADCGDQTQSGDELDGFTQHDVLLSGLFSRSIEG